MILPLDFARAVLLTMGFPVTENNVNALVAWQSLEGGHYANNAKFNPLNTTQKMPGSYNPGFSAGVQAYLNWQQGLDATVKTLSYGMYESIRRNLAASSDADVTLRAINDTNWGTKNYQGNVKALLGYATHYDPRPNEGGDLPILHGTFFSRLKERLPWIGLGAAILGGVAYFATKE